MARTIVVTGATGFIGRALCRHLRAQGHEVCALVRDAPAGLDHGASVTTGDLETAPEEMLQAALRDAFAVVHLAGRAHVMDNPSPDSTLAYKRANVDATKRIIAAAVRARVPKLIFASTVKVNGERTSAGHPFRPEDPPAPADDYARSKAEAERIVLAARDNARAVAPTVLRLPLVYGPGVKGNFARLIDAVASERTLPIGAIEEKRSILYVGNLCSAIDAVLAAGDASGVHFVADRESMSSPDLARVIGEVLGMPALVVYAPRTLLRVGASLTGRGGDFARLASALEVDTTSLRNATGWTPPHSLREGIEATIAWWRLHHSI